ncbi:Fe-S cluster assembly protein HesB [Patescibacteria group bacterium]|nr:Fe-S cluster assembly protein HesB [Patescibacteria group bacterium]
MTLPRMPTKKFQNMIFSWWKENRRDLPWRRTRDPYHILVSEVMLQQTQVLRVVPKYAEFLAAFPDVYSLAAATPAQVLTLWRGLGYNRRALYLQKAAKTIVTDYQGRFPDSETELIKLPGLGLYTARAIMVFAFEKNVAMVDTNIRQIITHYIYNGLPQKEKIIQETADRLVPAGRAWEWHQALMDFGALAMVKEKKTMHIVKKQAPFKDSDRYYRGRVIDVLRVSNAKETRLVANFVREYGKTAKYFHRIINGLKKDGLLVKKNSFLMLP